MEEEIQLYKEQSILLCQKLIKEINRNEDDAQHFFGGEIYRAYIKANDYAEERMNYILRLLQSTN